jgi:large subunit ribosomal protein L18
MAKGPTYKVEYRRRREGKTNYRKRLNLLKSGKPRLVIRKSNKYIIAQIVEYMLDGDRVIVTAHSSELKKKFQWKFSTKNTPASYLTGLLCGYKAKARNISKAILDIGLNPSVKGSRIYATMKGVLDAGIEIPHSDEVLPNEARIRGEDIATYTKKEGHIIKKNFDETKKLIEKSFIKTTASKSKKKSKEEKK